MGADYEYKYFDADTGKEISPPINNVSSSSAPGVNAKPRNDASIIEALLNVNEFKNNLYHFLRNETYNQETLSWGRLPGVKPLLNDEALTEIWAVVNTIIDKHSATANITNDQLEGMTKVIGRTIHRFLAKNKQRFELDTDKVDRLFSTLTFKIHLFLSMALNGDAFKKIITTWNVVENRTNNEKQGLLDGLFKGKGGN